MSEITLHCTGQISTDYSQRVEFNDKAKFKTDIQDLKDRLYQMFQSGLSINSIAIMALENLAELSKYEQNFRSAIMFLEEAIELYSQIGLEKVLNCIKKILEINSHINDRTIEKKYNNLSQILQQRHQLKVFMRGKKF